MSCMSTDQPSYSFTYLYRH